MKHSFLFTYCNIAFLFFVQQTSGQIERLDDQINLLIADDAVIEVLADGFKWSEGPVWVPELEALLFTDVPANKAYRWDEKNGLQLYLDPSGYTGLAPNEKKSGANGLILDSNGNLLIAQHGDRRIAKINAPLANGGTFTAVVDQFQGKRFHSPNDLILSSSGVLFFTDPPYGLEGDTDPLRELSHNGVYRLDPNGSLSLVYGKLSRPNGLAFSKDESVLYVANSDAKQNLWLAFGRKDGNYVTPRIFFDATTSPRAGLADGLKVHSSGMIFATGPGGVLILSPEGKHLGTILTEGPTANCAFDAEEAYLYMTSNRQLTRIKLKN